MLQKNLVQIRHHPTELLIQFVSTSTERKAQFSGMASSQELLLQVMLMKKFPRHQDGGTAVLKLLEENEVAFPLFLFKTALGPPEAAVRGG